MTLPESEQAESQPQVSQEEDIETIKKTLADEKAKAEVNLAGWQRAQADFINYKKICEQDKADVVKYANTQLVLAILPALDDLQRALDTVPDECAKPGWVEGIKAIERKLRSALELQGVSQIPALGEEFDPHVHEAVSFDKGKRDVVVKELLKGYRLHDRLIRAAQVILGSGEEDRKKEK